MAFNWKFRNILMILAFCTIILCSQYLFFYKRDNMSPDNVKISLQNDCLDTTVCILVAHNPKQTYDQQSSRCFDEIISTIQDGVSTLGGTSCRKNLTETSQFEQCSNSKYQIFFGYHVLSLFSTKVTVPPSTIIYNMEQVGDTKWFTPETISLLLKHPVWDYSSKNIEELKKKNINPHHVPVSYSHNLQRIASKPEKDIDVLLIGTCNPRRCTIISQLRAQGIKAFIAGDADLSCSACDPYRLPIVYGQDRDNLLARSHIHLNVHYYEVGVFEIVRVSYLLANSLFVISETGRLQDEEEEYFSTGIVFSKYENIVQTVVDYMKTPELRTKISNIGYDLMSKRSITPHIRCPLFSQKTYFSGINLFTEKKHAPVLATPYSIEHMTAFVQEYPVPSCFRVLAVMAGYNEADILASSIIDLIEQGVDIHYVDNWSTDNTAQLIQDLQNKYPGRIEYERWPTVKTSDTFDLGNLLLHTSEVSRQSKCDWAIHVDADELRESPWGHSVSIKKAIYIADQLGYNLVNFGNVLIFPPVNGTNFISSQQNNLRKTFKYFVPNKFRMDGIQIKSWKTYYNSCAGRHTFRKPVIMNLASTGGHIARYVKSTETRLIKEKLFPYNFFLRHYPIRSQQHGLRKVFRERKSRWNETERQNDWHKQYENVNQPDYNFVENSARLRPILEDGSLPPNMYANSLPCPTPSDESHEVSAGEHQKKLQKK